MTGNGKSRKEKDRQGWLLIAAVVGAVVVLIGIKASLNGSRTPDAFNCLGTPDTNTVIVFDRSEGTSEQTLREMRSRALTFIKDSTRENERITVFTVSDLSKNSLVPLISLCRPPASGNALVTNVKAIQKRFHDRFEAPLDTALNLEPGNAPESPLAQAIIDISRTSYLRGKRNTLLVFSDMLENTKEFSLYGCNNPRDVVARFRQSRLGGVVRPSFVNTRVVLNLIPRAAPSPTSIACRDALWVWFFGDDSGAVAGVTLDYLPGALGSGRGKSSTRE